MSNEIPAISVSSPEKNESDTSLKKLLANIQTEINSYKAEHQSIRNELTTVIEDNKSLAEQKRKNITASADETLDRLQNEAVATLKNQLYFTTQEKETLDKLWRSSQATVVGLEHEIREYRHSNKSQQQYVEAIKYLESNLKELKQKLNEQIMINETLKAKKQGTEEQLQSIRMKFDDFQTQKLATEANFTKTKTQLNEVMKEKVQLEQTLTTTKKIANEHILRETQALTKVQEAISVAETAYKREQVIREECDFLANTIGKIMEEAAQKVEQDRQEMKKKHEQQVNKMEKQVHQLKAALKMQTQKVAFGDNRNKLLEDKIKELVETNLSLDADLQQATKAIIEMEIKLETFQKTISVEECTKSLYEEKTKELENIVDSHNKLKERWKSTVLEITEKLESKIKELQIESTGLRKENVELRKLLSESSS